MNRTSIASRLDKLEAETRATGRVHTINARSHDGDRAKVEAQFKTDKATLIASGQAGPDDLFVCFATFYESAPAWRPAAPVTAWAEPAVETGELTQAERLDRLAARTARSAPPAAERQPDASDRAERLKCRHASLLAASPAHPPVGH